MKQFLSALGQALKSPAKLALGLVAVATLGACSGAPIETSRNMSAPVVAAPLATGPVASPFDIQSVVVEVPRTLQVSEQKRLLPRGDIVWREDPYGDRYAQVEAIVQNAMEQGAERMTPGAVPAILRVEITRFHSLSERARATIGGVHNISFNMSLHDPATGRPYGPVQKIKAPLKAFGGVQAKEALQLGQTQKVRITNHLINVLHEQMSQPEGYVAQNFSSLNGAGQL